MRFDLAIRPFRGLAIVVALTAGSTVAQVTSVPPAEYVAPAGPKAARVERLLSSDVPRRVVALPAPTAVERAQLDLANAPSAKSVKAGTENATGKGRPLAIGFGRSVPVAERTISGADLSWQSLPDGGRAARIDVSSEGAAAIRVALTMQATTRDVAIRFTGAAADAPVFGPYRATAIAEATTRDGKYWSPVIEGPTATIEIYVPSGVSPSSVGLTLAGISHLLVGGEGLRKVDAKIGIGTSQACEIDVACVTPQTGALTNAARSVARISFVGDTGISYYCSGTLLNDSIASMTPYFYTAAHCMTSQYAARTLNLFFFFDAVSCGSKLTPPYAQMTGGGMLLGRSEDWDWALVRLDGTLPTGTFLAAWSAESLTTPSTDAIVLHHPNADLKKWSSGKTQGISSVLGGSTMTRMVYSQGSTEGGSSGAAIMTFNPAFGGYYEVRGGLYGGDASCNNPSGSDYFSRFDNALPLLRQYLAPSSPNPRGVIPAIEFVNTGLNLYFLSANPAEINDLDTGVHPGWARTGEMFLVYSDPEVAPADASPVCRLYEKPGFHDAHFYSASPSECADALEKFGDHWLFESANVFYIQTPDQATGICPANTQPVWRYLNNFVTNHRYTTEVGIRTEMANNSFVWTPEGYGPGPYFPIMCSPLQ